MRRESGNGEKTPSKGMPAGAKCSILRKLDTCRCSEVKQGLVQETGEFSKLALPRTAEPASVPVSAHSGGVKGERWVQLGQADIRKSSAHLRQT